MARIGVCVLWIALSVVYLPPQVLSDGPVRLAGSGGTVGELAVPVILANATAALTPKYGPVDLSYQAVDSPQDINNVLSGADDFASTYIPLTAQAYKAAGRVLLQIPWAIANIAVIVNVPGVDSGQLRLNARVLAGIYQCTITNWNDPAIAALNPSLTLPDLKITPASYTAGKATTQIVTEYLATAPGWTLGVSTQVPWPRCVQHLLTPQDMLDAVSKAAGAISWVGNWRVNASFPAPTALMQNAAGNFLGPMERFSAASQSFPASLTSPDWANVNFAASGQPDIYPLSGPMYNIVNQDVSGAGQQQALVLRDLMEYFLSDEVQSNLSSLDMGTLPTAMIESARAQVAQMTVTPSNSSAAVPAAGPSGASAGLVTNGAVIDGSGGTSVQNLVYSVIKNGTAANMFDGTTVSYAPTDDIQGKAGVVTNSLVYGVSELPYTNAEIAAAGRPIIQVPVGFNPVALAHNLPGIQDGALRLTPTLVARIYQCTITNWSDPLIAAANPSLTLPNATISAFGLADVSGSTSLLGMYASRSQDWTLGTASSLAWPRCIRRTTGGSVGELQALNGTAYALGYSSLNALVTTSGPRLPVASLMNRAGSFVSPYTSVFPFTQDELPNSISSPDWNKLDLNMTVRSDKYPIGGLIYILADQDLTTEGYPQGLSVQEFLLYWLSDTVQGNLAGQGATPMLTSYLAQERQQVAALNAIPTANVTSAGAPQPGPGSSKAGFPWWAGLIIALVVVAILGAATLAACLVIRRRRRRRGSAAVETALHQKDEEAAKKRDDFQFNRGSDDPPLLDNRGPRAPVMSTRTSRNNMDRTPSLDSDNLILVARHHVQDDSTEHRIGAGGFEMANGGSSGGRRSVRSAPGAENRSGGHDYRTNSLPKDMAGHSDIGSVTSSRGQSLNNEANTQSLPGLLRARANSIDADEVERGSLLGRGSFGKVYHGWWRGGSVAIKIVPHEGELGEKVDALRESLLCSAIQHPHIVTTYKVLTVQKGAHYQRMRQETIPEGGEAVGISSPDGSSGAGTGNTGLSSSSPGMSNLMETWIIMEYCDLGSLDSAIADGRFHDLESMLLRLLDVAMGMDYLHNLGILHTDLKPSNVLLKTTAKLQNDSTGCTAKLADFGLSRVLETNATHISTNTIGTIAYQPEEVLRDGHVTPASDVYSFAILMYEMYTRKHLFKGMMHSQMFFKVFNGYRPPIPPGMPKGLKDLMTAAWSHNPAERPSYRSIVKMLQRLIREHRRAMGRAVSVNLDEALSLEPAPQFPIAPAMPIKVPSGPPPESSSAESAMARATSGASATPNPSNNAQGAAAPDDFERALKELRAKAAAERAAAPPPQRPSPATAAPAAAPAAPAASNGNVSAFSAFAAAAAMPPSSDSSDGSSARGSRADGAAAARAGPGRPETAAPAAPTTVSPPFSPTAAAATAAAFAASAQHPRPISGPKNYDLLLGD
ncbi:probable focal adhesion kinase 1 at C-terminar half [Coccomyxa sp. Obi]|nr:probable focal adhesion kinase 1 at C-terminar half [Coccomyxa sp. Obi]